MAQQILEMFLNTEVLKQVAFDCNDAVDNCKKTKRVKLNGLLTEFESNIPDGSCFLLKICLYLKKDLLNLPTNICYWLDGKHPARS